MNRGMCPDAVAWIRGGKTAPSLRGRVQFFRRCGGSLVEAELEGLPDSASGFFAFHIHDGVDCGGEGFSDTGGHYNPGKTEHPRHGGDLPPLLADHGKAYLKVMTGRFRVEEVIGKTVVVHANPDDFHTQPSGNAGAKIACGVIERA